MKLLKRISRFFKRYINGTKGAVSIFLALTLSPLLSVALILVESARYQDAIERIQEVVDVSAFSSLADYDSYLDERFGLLATSQESDINGDFDKYLGKNVNALGNSVTIDSKSAQGEFPLSNTDVLKQQILEYSEISVPTQIATELINLEGLLDDLYENLGLDELNKEIEVINASVEFAKELEKLLKAIKDTINQYTKYADALEKYKTAYSDFETKVVAVANALKAAENASPEEAVYYYDYINITKENAIRARNTYVEKATKLKEELESLKKNIGDIFDASAGIPVKYQDYTDKQDKLNGRNEATTTQYEWLRDIASHITQTLDILVGQNFEDDVNTELRALQQQINDLNSFGSSTITSAWSAATVKSKYGPVSITSIKDTFGLDLTDLISLLNNETVVDDEEKASIENLMDIVGELIGISGLYDSSLDSFVNEGSLYASIEVSISGQASIISLTALINAGKDYIDGISSFDILKVLKAQIEYLVAVVAFLVAVVAWVGETIVNLVNLVAGGVKELYNSALLYGYGAYNMPNRTNYPDKKTLSGYSYSDIFVMAGGSYFGGMAGKLEELGSIYDQAGSDNLFKGAEAEYLLIGSTSELFNQSVTFFDLYLLRLLLDLKPILSSKEVADIAKLAGPYSWVVMMLIILAEPMLDTIILVNGGETYLVKDKVYLSYSGFSGLLEDIIDITAISKNIQDKIKGTFKEEKDKNKKEETKVLAKVSYTEHMFILLLLSVNPETYMRRLQNLIQMEGAQYYKDSFAFSLDETYTYIYSEVDYTLNPMLDFDSLTGNGLFTAESKQYLGY